MRQRTPRIPKRGKHALVNRKAQSARAKAAAYIELAADSYACASNARTNRAFGEHSRDAQSYARCALHYSGVAARLSRKHPENSKNS